MSTATNNKAVKNISRTMEQQHILFLGNQSCEKSRVIKMMCDTKKLENIPAVMLLDKGEDVAKINCDIKPVSYGSLDLNSGESIHLIKIDADFALMTKTLGDFIKDIISLFNVNDKS